MEEKHVGESNLKSLIAWIRKRLSKKLESVTNNDDSIEVTERRKVSVKVSPADGNRLQVKQNTGEEGLYVPSDSEPIATDEEVDEMIVDVFDSKNLVS